MSFKRKKTHLEIKLYTSPFGQRGIDRKPVVQNTVGAINRKN